MPTHFQGSWHHSIKSPPHTTAFQTSLQDSCQSTPLKPQIGLDYWQSQRSPHLACHLMEASLDGHFVLQRCLLNRNLEQQFRMPVAPVQASFG